jgi:hypothetical protein
MAHNNLAFEILNSIKQNAFQVSSVNKLKHSDTLTAGAVWHGDWATKSDTFKFGLGSGKNHFAMILWDKIIKTNKVTKSPGVRLAPITSQHKNHKKSVLLPKNTLKAYSTKSGYILPKIKLLIRKSRLENDFDFIQILDNQYVEKCKKVLQNG